MPQEYGVRQPYNFLFNRSYWFPAEQQQSEQFDAIAMEEDLVQPIVEDQPYETDALRVVHLRKEFKVAGEELPLVAVHNLNLTMVDGQITALLGHNGAGKPNTSSWQLVELSLLS